MDAGYEPEALIEELPKVAVGALPQPLEYLVRDTGRDHGRIRVLRTGCCLCADDLVLVREMEGARSLRRLGLRSIAPTVLVSARSEH